MGGRGRAKMRREMLEGCDGSGREKEMMENGLSMEGKEIDLMEQGVMRSERGEENGEKREEVGRKSDEEGGEMDAGLKSEKSFGGQGRRCVPLKIFGDVRRVDEERDERVMRWIKGERKARRECGVGRGEGSEMKRERVLATDGVDGWRGGWWSEMARVDMLRHGRVRCSSGGFWRGKGWETEYAERNREVDEEERLDDEERRDLRRGE
ncbi:hypothetical protein Tco_0169035 [Tanacetum coccineum]